MCERDGRDTAGRFTKGVSGNPAGRKPTSPVLKLVAAAEAAGAEVVIRLPARPVLPRSSDDLPPEAA